MAKVVSAHSLQRSWTYRNRSRVSGLVVLAAWAYVALTRPWIPQGSALDWLVDAAAWLAFLGGAALRLWATLWIAGRKKNKLVDDGPYRACRNPLYLGTFAMGIGLALFLKSLVFTGALGMLMLLYVWYVVPAEERYMPIQCADDYRGYCAPSSALDSTAQPAPPRRNFSPTRRPDGAPPRMPENGRLGAAGGAGPVDVPPPRNGLVGVVSRKSNRVRFE